MHAKVLPQNHIEHTSMAALLPMPCIAHSITSTLTSSSSPGPLVSATVARRNPLRRPLMVRAEAATTDCGSSSGGGGTANNKLSAWISVRHDDELLTVLPDLLAPRPGYLVVRMASGSNERKVIGRVDCRGGPTPGWMHSFAVTDRYVVVPEMSLRYSASSLVRSELAPYYAFDWLPASGSYMHVMCRSTGNTVASVEVPPFMAIHYINAYEDNVDGAAAIVVDCCEHYGDPAIIHTLLLHRLRSFGSDN